MTKSKSKHSPAPTQNEPNPFYADLCTNRKGKLKWVFLGKNQCCAIEVQPHEIPALYTTIKQLYKATKHL